jgi:bla regulator protein blaR1
MNLIFFKEFFSGRFLNAVCWTLFHSLWQGLIIALISGVVVILTRQSRPVLRYKFLSALFILLTLGFAITFVYELQKMEGLSTPSGAAYHEVNLSSPGSQNAVVITTHATTSFSDVIAKFLSENSPIIIAIWAIILCVKIAIMLFVLGYTRYITRRKSQEAPPHWKMRMIALCHNLHINKPVTLLESAILKLPVVFGELKPIILVPLGLLSQLSPEQVEAILIHELAHIRRHDFLVNLLQNIVETVFFFNPALLWLSSLIRDERENCCDDMVIAHTRNKKQYVESLISFQELSMYNRSASTAIVAFAGRKSSFVSRIRRIVENKNYALNTVEKGTLICSSLIVALMAMAFIAPHEAKVAEKIVSKPASKLSLLFWGVQMIDSSKLSSAYPLNAESKKTRTQGKEEPVSQLNNQLNIQGTNHFINIKEPTILKESITASQKKILADTIPEQNESIVREIMARVINDLVQEKVVASPAALLSFALDVDILDVNDQRQPESLHKKLLEKYGIQKNFGYYYGPEKASGHGFFFDNKRLDSLKYTAHEPAPKYSLERHQNDSLKLLLLQKRLKEFRYTDSLKRNDAELLKRRIAGLPRFARPMQEIGLDKIDQIIKNIIDDLILAGVIHERELVSFNLCNKELVVNGKAQLSSLHMQLLEKYVVPYYGMLENAGADPDFGFHIDLATGSSGLGFYRHVRGPI